MNYGVRWSSTLSASEEKSEKIPLLAFSFSFSLFETRESERTSEMLLSKRRSALFALLLLLLTAAAAQAAGWGSQSSKAEGVPPATPEPISDASSSATSSEVTPAPAVTPPPRADAMQPLEPRKVRPVGKRCLKKRQRRGKIREYLFVGLIDNIRFSSL